MTIVIVHIRIKVECQAEFEKATLENARQSLQEPGIARFDVLKMEEDSSQYILYEAYNKPEDQIKHRETKHYQVWKDIVSDMMAEPRQGIKYTNLYPFDNE